MAMTMTMETTFASLRHSSNLLDYTKSPAATTPTRRLCKYAGDSIETPFPDLSSLTPTKQLVLSPNLPFSPKKDRRFPVEKIAFNERSSDGEIKFQIRKRKQWSPVLTQASSSRAARSDEDLLEIVPPTMPSLIKVPTLKQDCIVQVPSEAYEQSSKRASDCVMKANSGGRSSVQDYESPLFSSSKGVQEERIEPLEIRVLPWDSQGAEVPMTPLNNKNNRADSPSTPNQNDLGIQIMMQMFNDIENGSLLFLSPAGSPQVRQSDLVRQTPPRSRSDEVLPRVTTGNGSRRHPKRSASNDGIPQMRNSLLSANLESRTPSPRRKKPTPETRKIPLRANSTDEGLQLLRKIFSDGESNSPRNVARRAPGRSKSDSRDNLEALRSVLLSPDKKGRRFYFAIRKKKQSKFDSADSDADSGSGSEKTMSPKESRKLKAIQKKLNAINPFRSSTHGVESTATSNALPECTGDRLTGSIQLIIQDQETSAPMRA